MLGLQFFGLTGFVILTANLLKHLHILNILEELTEKKICMHCALSISRKKIINSAYISSSSVLFNFLSGHRFLNKAFAKTRHNRRVVNVSLFFSFS